MSADYTATCARCNERIKWAFTCDDDTDAWQAVDGTYACSDYHGHDEDGVYAPMHSPEDDNDHTVSHDDDCKCVAMQQIQEVYA